MRRLRLQRVLEILGEAIVEVNGPTERLITHPAAMQGAKSGRAITFCNKLGADAWELIRSTQAGVILCSDDPSLDGLTVTGKTLLRVGNPRLSFIRLLKALFAEPTPTGIHPTAVVHPKARVDSSVFIGPFTYIGECEIGAGTIIDGHVHLRSKTRIGRNVVIHAGAVIGSDGYGYERNPLGGESEKMPHLGGVIIEDDVEIGANTCIDRGTLGDTVIREGAKIDNLVHIAHNVVIGRKSAIIAHAMVGGSTNIGECTWIAPCACLRNGLSIGEKATVGLAAVVLVDVPDGAVVMGAPARTREDYSKILTAVKQLAGVE